MTTSTVVLAEAFAAVLGVLATWSLAGLVLAVVIRYRRRPVELRGDWWTSFEREFRAYAAVTSGAADAPRRRRADGDSPPSPAAP